MSEEQKVTKEMLINKLNELIAQKAGIEEQIRDLRNVVGGYELAEKNAASSKPSIGSGATD